jgi:hypothetical protein
MNKTSKILLLTAGVIIAVIAAAQAQNKIDEDRMNRDIAVAENVLSTLIRQQFSKRNFFPFEVEGSYMPGFGITFRLPSDFSGKMLWIMNDQPGSSVSWSSDGANGLTITTSGIDGSPGTSFSGSSNVSTSTEDECEDCPKNVRVRSKKSKLAPRAAKRDLTDSLRINYNAAIIQASKDFIADYGDLISQLAPDERIVITNKMDRSRNNWLWQSKGSSDLYLSMEVLKSDLNTFKQGKINRDQFLAKIKTINTETTDDLSPDLELLSSIFNRLYRPDLSKTYFIQEDVYYDRLKDYGVIYEMRVYSSTGADFGQYDMPTLGLRDVAKDERFKRVKELYPSFEKNLLDDVLEYGKTLKSLKENEVLIFNVKLTECKGCGIPSTLEISVKNNVLKDYSSGKLSKEAALTKLAVKKGLIQ